MEYEVGQRWQTQTGMNLRIMAIADKHIMCRYTGCIPFVKSIKEFPKFLESIKAVEIIKNMMTRSVRVPRRYEIFQFKDGKWAIVTQTSPTIKVAPFPWAIFHNIPSEDIIDKELEFKYDEWPEIKQIFDNVGENSGI